MTYDCGAKRFTSPCETFLTLFAVSASLRLDAQWAMGRLPRPTAPRDHGPRRAKVAQLPSRVDKPWRLQRLWGGSMTGPGGVSDAAPQSPAWELQSCEVAQKSA